MSERDRDREIDWLPEDALEAFAEESLINPTTQPAAAAQEIFRRNAPVAALAIVRLAKYGSNERTRLDAAKYVTERVLGKPQDSEVGGAEAPLEKLLRDVVGQAEAFANGQGQ